MTRLERKKLSIELQGSRDTATTNDHVIARSSSVSNNMTRLERKKLSIEGYCNNKRLCIARSLNLSYNMTRLERKKISIEGYDHFIIKTVSMG